MTFRGRLNAALLAMAVACAGFWLLGGDPAPLHPTVTEWRPGDISTLSLERNGALVWRLARVKDAWHMQEPSVSVVDQERVQVLLGILRTHSLQQIPFSADALARYGLDRPRFRLATDRVMLELGRREPLTGGRYLRVGDQIHLIGDGYLHHLLAPVTAWTRQDA